MGQEPKVYNTKLKISPSIEIVALIDLDLRQMQPVQHVFIQCSCDNEQATTSNLFSEHLLKNMERKETDIRVLFQRVSDGVFQESEGQQKPLIIDGFEQGMAIYLWEIMEGTCLYPYPLGKYVSIAYFF